MLAFGQGSAGPLALHEAKACAILVHNEYRNALLNQKYFGCRLTTLEKWNRGMEVVVVVGTTGAAGTGIANLSVAGLSIWQTGPGVVAWGILSGVAVVLSAVKPILNLPALIEKYGKLYGEYASLFASLRTMEHDFRRHNAITGEQMQTFDKLMQRSNELESLGPPRPNRALLIKLQDEVNREIPPASLWMPSAAPPRVPPQTSPVVPGKPGDPSPAPGSAVSHKTRDQAPAPSEAEGV